MVFCFISYKINKRKSDQITSETGKAEVHASRKEIVHKAVCYAFSHSIANPLPHVRQHALISTSQICHCQGLCCHNTCTATPVAMVTGRGVSQHRLTTRAQVHMVPILCCHNTCTTYTITPGYQLHGNGFTASSPPPPTTPLTTSYMYIYTCS